MDRGHAACDDARAGAPSAAGLRRLDRCGPEGIFSEADHRSACRRCAQLDSTGCLLTGIRMAGAAANEEACRAPAALAPPWHRTHAGSRRRSHCWHMQVACTGNEADLGLCEPAPGCAHSSPLPPTYLAGAFVACVRSDVVGGLCSVVRARRRRARCCEAAFVCKRRHLPR